LGVYDWSQKTGGQRQGLFGHGSGA
jgi:hypothetical protein